MKKREENLECSVCLKEFDTLEQLELHWSVHFRHYGAQIDSVQVDNNEEKGKDRREKFLKCAQCNFKARLAFALNRHNQKAHNSMDVKESILQTTTSGKVLYDQEKQDHKPKPKRIMIVSKAEEIFLLKDDENLAYICEVCEYKAGNTSELQAHVKNVHLRIKISPTKGHKPNLTHDMICNHIRI